MVPLAIAWPLLLAPSTIPTPNFAQYPAQVASPAPSAAPRLLTQEERRFRTVLRQAVRKGYGVVDGGTEHERPGPNFAGHFVLVQWGCGLSCMDAALIDTRDGTVLHLPSFRGHATKRAADSKPDSFRLLTCDNDLRTLHFRTDSRLLGGE